MHHNHMTTTKQAMQFELNYKQLIEVAINLMFKMIVWIAYCFKSY